MEKENENGTGERKASLLTTASLVPSKEISLSIIILVEGIQIKAANQTLMVKHMFYGHAKEAEYVYIILMIFLHLIMETARFIKQLK